MCIFVPTVPTKQTNKLFYHLKMCFVSLQNNIQSTNTTDIVEDSQTASPVKTERKDSIVEANSDQDEPPSSADGPELASSSDDRVREMNANSIQRTTNKIILIFNFN